MVEPIDDGAVWMPFLGHAMKLLVYAEGFEEKVGGHATLHTKVFHSALQAIRPLAR